MLPLRNVIIEFFFALLALTVADWELATPVVASTAAPAFIAARTFSLITDTDTNSGNPRSVAIGDFNHDGKADIATANYSSPTVSVLLANGDGTFGAATKYSVGSFPRFVLARDLNGDGNLDLAVVNSNETPGVSILLGDGLGGFGPAIGFSAGASPQSMAIADFNGDGKLDLVVANAGSNDISVLLGDGTGHFSSPVSVAVGADPLFVVAGDFNGDSRPDLAVTSFNSGDVEILLGNGAGRFGTPQSIVVGINPTSILATDLNGDGKQDLVVTNQGSNSVSVMLGTGTGSFGSPTNFATGTKPVFVAGGDFNGDAKLDLAVANSGSNDISILLGDGSGNFAAPMTTGGGPIPQALAVNDFNSDGRADIALVNSNAPSVWILAGKGDGSFVGAPSFPTGLGPSAVAVGDFNRDGKADLVTANNNTNDVSILLGDGKGSFGSPTNFAVGANPQSLAIADFNSDGKIDLVVGNTGSNNVSVLMGNGAGSFAPALTLALPGTALSVATGDFNGDGKTDIVAAVSGTGFNAPTASVLLGDGSGGFSAPVTLVTNQAGEAGYSVIASDFNSDGISDIAVGTETRVVIFLGNRNGVPGSPTYYQGPSFSKLVAGDFNDDGKIDLAGSSPFSVFLGNGDGTFNKTDSAPAFVFSDIALGDFNGDAKSDICLMSRSVSVINGDGAGGFAPRFDFAAGPSPVSLVGGDFNSDGRLDLAVADSATNKVFILLNSVGVISSSAISFSSSSYTVNEGDQRVNINVTRTGDTSGSASVDYKTVDDPAPVRCDVINHTAYARCDYATTLDTLTFGPGDTSKTFAIPIIDDSYAEGNETFQIALSNPVGASLGSPTTATVTITDNDAVNGPNPILLTNNAGVSFFVRQHYLDFLAREPEMGEPWSAILNGCADQFNVDPGSLSAGCDRITVSGSFFGSPEFRLKGLYTIVFYRVAFNRLPDYLEFAPDVRSVTGATAAETNAKRAAFANNFVVRTEFLNTYGGMTNSTYVSTLMGHYSLASITTPDPANPDGGTKVTLTTNDLINGLNGATLTRAQVLRAIVTSDQVSLNFEAVNAFVASQYYGYLRRTPDTGGFNSWVNYLNAHPSDFRTMVNGFVNSIEYRLRFGPT